MLKKEAACSSRMVYNLMMHKNPEDHNLKSHYHENIKFYKNGLALIVIERSFALSLNAEST
jgi:hypothetical protein